MLAKDFEVKGRRRQVVTIKSSKLAGEDVKLNDNGIETKVKSSD